MVRGLGHAHAHAEIEFPVLAQIDIDGGQELLLLVAHSVETGERAYGAVILHSHSHFLGHVVTEFDVGRELEPALGLGSMQRAIERRVEGQVPLAQFLVDDRPDLPSPRVQ